MILTSVTMVGWADVPELSSDVSVPSTYLVVFKLIVTCRLCVIYVMEDNVSNVEVMITQLTDFMDLVVRCPEKGC